MGWKKNEQKKKWTDLSNKKMNIFVGKKNGHIFFEIFRKIKNISKVRKLYEIIFLGCKISRLKFVWQEYKLSIINIFRDINETMFEKQLPTCDENASKIMFFTFFFKNELHVSRKVLIVRR